MAMPRIPEEPDLQNEAYEEDENDPSPRVLVDASNVAHSTEGGEARLRNIQLVQEKLREAGLEAVIVADAALRHQIDDKPAYETLIDQGKVHQAPAGTDAVSLHCCDHRELAVQRQLEDPGIRKFDLACLNGEQAFFGAA